MDAYALVALGVLLGGGSVAALVIGTRERHGPTGKDAEIARQLEENSMLRRLLDRAPILISHVDAELRYSFNNRRYTEWFGISQGELRGREIHSVLPEPVFRRLQPAIRRAFAGETSLFETVLPYQGEPRPVHAAIVPDRGRRGDVSGFFVFVTDVKIVKDQEARLRQHDRLASIGTLAAGVAHEINNPTGAILASAEVALAEDAPASVRASLNEIIDQAERTARIVKQVLRFARAEPSEKKDVDLCDMIRSGRHLVEKELQQLGTRVHLEGEPCACPLHGNPTELEQVFVNLFQNAAQAGASNVWVTIANAEQEICAEIRDDGQGMTQEQIEHAFDPFYTTRVQEGGTGLGLSLVHGIVRDHGGDIDVENADAGGTRLRLTLPRRSD